MSNAESILKELIETKGPKHLQKAPMSVYKSLLAGDVPPKLARILLITLLDDAPDKAQKMAEEQLSSDFQTSCGLRKDAADEAAQIYSSLFSLASMEERKAQEKAGFRAFCEKEWEFFWEGSAVWHYGGMHIDCYADLTATLIVDDAVLAERTVEPLLKENPFASAEMLRKRFEALLSHALDIDLREYVTAEEYYEPVMDDYGDTCEDTLKYTCKKLGLRVESSEISASGSDYIED